VAPRAEAPGSAESPDSPDFAREAFRTLQCEPYRVKVVQRLRLPTRVERQRILELADYSPARIDAGDVFVDLVTDSGTGAMSDTQWGALMTGDETYVRSQSYLTFEGAVREVCGFEHVIPTPQGRAAEAVALDLLVKSGDMVLSNTHSDTTRTHVERRGATALDLVDDAAWDFREPRAFRGNFDLAKLSRALDLHAGRVPLVIATVTNNVACSAPVALANLRAAAEIAARHSVPLFVDACRFAENAFFVKTTEAGRSGSSVRELALELFSLAQGTWMSARKDALANVGGFLAVRDGHLASRARARGLVFQGFYTQGGLAGRDLQAIAVGLREGLDEEHLAHRTGLVAYLGELLHKIGIPVARPVGGSAVFVDPRPLYPALSPGRMPAIALFADLYREGGLRVGPVSSQSRVLSASGAVENRPYEYVRLAVPRRTYTRTHLEYVAAIFERVKAVAAQSRGFRVLESDPELGAFGVRYAPVTD
jgi:tyrosine phenol-lyase